eukprot:m.11535 g.11535  ORF g.11535 m.11535 type:complete len:89 (-) comp15677_c0_seq1:19-285(-)
MDWAAVSKWALLLADDSRWEDQNSEWKTDRPAQYSPTLVCHSFGAEVTVLPIDCLQRATAICFPMLLSSAPACSSEPPCALSILPLRE